MSPEKLNNLDLAKYLLKQVERLRAERDALRADLDKALRFIDSVAAETYAVESAHAEVVLTAQKVFADIVLQGVDPLAPLREKGEEG